VSGQAVGVVDDTGGQRFTLEQDGVVAELVYRHVATRLVLVHTEVPAALGGRGVGGQLISAAIARARREGLTLVPYCPFARKWLQDHPDATAGVKIDWPAPDAVAP
jgi:predicted GNAT family acetyltransferase